MENFSPLLGINLPILGKSNSLITPSRLCRESRIPAVQLNQIARLDSREPLIQASRLLANTVADPLHNSTNQSQIGWDNWQPIDRSSNRDNFNYKIDRSHFNLDDRSSQIDTVGSPVLDFFTTVLSAESAEIDPQLDSLSAYPAEVEIPTPSKKDRFAKANATQIETLGEIQAKSFEPDRKSSDSNQIDQIEQPKSLIKVPQAATNTQPPSILQSSPITLGESKIAPESSIALSLDNLALNAIDNSFLQPLLETTIDLNLDSNELVAINPTQISRSADEIAPNLASPPELILDSIVPNPLDAPAIINPAITPQVTLLESAVATSIISESAALSPEILAPFPVLEQIAKAIEIAPNPESSGRLPSDPSDPIIQNPLDSPTVVDLQPPTSTTAQPPLSEQRSAVAENIASVMPLTVEPVREIPSLNRSELPTIESHLTTAAQTTTSPEESGIASPAIPDSSSTLPRSVDLAQIATKPNETEPTIESSDRDLDPSPPIKSANPNIPESPIALPADALPTNLRSAHNPDPHPEQTTTSDTPIEIAADLQSTQVLNVDTFQLNSLDATTINQASSALEQISTFADESTPENLETSPIPIAESVNTVAALPLSLAKSPLPWRIEPDLTIKSIPKLSDSLRSNSDRSSKEDIPLETPEIITVEQDNITKSNDEFSLDNSLISPLVDRSIVDPPQSNDQPENLSADIVDKFNDIANPTNNSTHAIQLDPVTTELPTIDREEVPLISIDSSNKNLDIIPAPIVGYATGGYVKDVDHIDLQSIATSDTVSAMLTPGEFVINAKAAQTNLDLLTHINSGGEPETALLKTEIQPSILVPTSTDISLTSIQRKPNNSLFSPSLQREINLQQLSPLINPALDPVQSNQAESSKSSPTYSSPSMIFRKPRSSAQAQYSGADTPDEWGSIEDLMNGGSHNSDVFSMGNSPQQHSDLESRSLSIISPKYTSPIKGFADGGEVTPSDIATTIAPITHTIESPINTQQQDESNNPAELEILAREIYHRLRQRLEIERERHGNYSGNLAW